MLVAGRHVERRRIITESERRRPWLPNRPAARVRTDAPLCDRDAPCRCGCRSNAFDCCGDVAPAQGRERHGVRKPRDGRPARCTRRTRRLPVRIGDGRAGRSRRCAFPTTAFFEMPIRRPISAVDTPLTRVAAVHGSHRPSIQIRSSRCASGSPAAAVSSETPPRGLPGARRARARKRPDRPLRGAHAGSTVVAVVSRKRGAGCRAIGRRLNLRR